MPLFCIIFLLGAFLVQYGIPILILIFVIRAILKAARKKRKQKEKDLEGVSSGPDEKHGPIIDYIRNARASGTDDAEIAHLLAHAGWAAEDIKRAFDFVR